MAKKNEAMQANSYPVPEGFVPEPKLGVWQPKGASPITVAVRARREIKPARKDAAPLPIYDCTVLVATEGPDEAGVMYTSGDVVCITGRASLSLDKFVGKSKAVWIVCDGTKQATGGIMLTFSVASRPMTREEESLVAD